jgi:isocitrate dehydrogenase
MISRPIHKQNNIALSSLYNLTRRHLSTATVPIISPENKVLAPPMVYISGEEMTHYAMDLIVDQWIKPYFDVCAWQYFDLSCKARDQTHDKVLKDAVDAGKKIGAIFKEPTITPSAAQV